MPSTVASGLDKLTASGFVLLKGANVGILANQASVNSDCQHIVDLCLQSKACTVKKLFAPEHGFRGELQDMEHVDSSVDTYTGLPTISLYGSSAESLTPSKDDLKGIDILLFDLQDIGARYYTFAQSLAFCMKACGANGTRLVVVDRPNPINGLTLEGNKLQAKCRSFCGYAPVPARHGLTIGELAKLMHQGFEVGSTSIPQIDCELDVICLEGWNRGDYFSQTKLPWVLPSPNMPTLETAVVYPGACLFEATNISEGRGTTKPFEFVGAPYIDGFEWARAVHDLGIGLDGVKLRPLSFVPHYSKHQGKLCYGVQIHVTDRSLFKPIRLCLALIYAAKALYPKDFSWRHEAYEFVDKVPAIDLLHGSNSFRHAVEAQSPLQPVIEKMSKFETNYAAKREEYLLY
jgi:uncharacterized protein YbbC (DUF1343 family)